MAVLPADLIYPTGELRTEWFEGEDLADNLDVWIMIGEARAPEDATTDQVDSISLPYAYWRAYDAKTMQMAASPDSVKLEDLSRTQVKGRDFFAKKAAAWKAAFESALSGAETVGEAASTSVTQPSRTVPFSVVW